MSEKVNSNAERIAKLETTVENIRDNHLAHMAEDIDRIESKMDKVEAKLWYILILLVASTIIGMLGEKINALL